MDGREKCPRKPDRPITDIIAAFGGLLVAFFPVCLGCVELNALNPYYRQQWAEDERIMPSFHSHWKRIRQLETAAHRMSYEDQRQSASELTRLIKEDSNLVLRIAAVRSLAAFPPEIAREGVLVALADKDAEVRIAACEALRRIGDDGAIDVLASLVETDSNLDVRLAATRALGGLDHPAAWRALAVALDDRDPALQYRAMEWLAQTTGRSYGYDVALWKAYLRGENPPQPPPPSIVERIRDSIFR